MNGKVVNLRKQAPLILLLIIIITFAGTFSIIFKLYGHELYLPSSAVTDISRVVIIDAGHGGEDCGAIGVNGAYEKDLNLAVAIMIGEGLAEQGYIPVFTRTEDKLLYKPEEDIKGIRKISDLKNRCAIAAQYPKAPFISIHMNKFGQSNCNGAQIYCSSSDGSQRLGELIKASIKEDLQPDNNRGLKGSDGIYLLENMTNPAVLVECGFLSNPEECELLCKKEYQKQLSFSIVCAIIEYMKKI